ncbi:hypothetical protein WR25_16307 [Diploscapter pachys]|uniref:SH3 domain-containing protein n=1 Tax=Diploscapter pachys TaxID=2018661 RepID=A0A2A2JCY6_9BILA|nr:hypothetical protein WR25_16307 [Diploscapter pachys]
MKNLLGDSWQRGPCAVQSPGNFRQLRDLITKNNNLLGEVIAAFEEKAALDFQYSKTLKKISSRLHNALHDAECQIDKGWTSAAEQFDIQSTLHSNLGSALTDDIVQPLKSIKYSQTKTLKAAEIFVEKETKKLKDKKEDVMKQKRSLYVASKELEKCEAQHEKEQNLQNNKNLVRKRRLQEQVKRSEDEYIWATIDLEKQRRVTENVLRKGVESLEAVEKQRLAHCQTAIGRYQRKVEQLAPNIQQMFERHASNLDAALQADSTDYITSIQPSTSAVNHITLTDLYAENFAEIMCSSRRRAALDRVSTLLDTELKRLYSKGTADLLAVNTKQITLVEFIEYLFYKINDAINSLDGGQHKGYHRLSRFQHKLKDKFGLSMTILTIPITGEDQSLPPPSLNSTSQYAPSSRGSNDDYEEYDQISDEGFHSSSRQTTIIDEPATTLTICRVLYDFTPKHADEIEIKAGQCVLVEDKIGDDWLVGRVIPDPTTAENKSQLKSNGSTKSGRFPTSYVAF